MRHTRKQENMPQRKEQNKFLENGPKEMGYINYLVKNSKLPS